MDRQDELNQILKNIVPIDAKALEEGKNYCDRLAKPLGALGKMEKMYARLHAMFPDNIKLTKKMVMIYVADNGVCDEGISSNPIETTFIVANNIRNGKAGVANIAEYAGSDICVIDIGCKSPIYPDNPDHILNGTRNMLKEPAMTRQEALEAILVGYRRTVELINQGYTLFGTGEMGVGNTTTSASVIAATLGLPAQEVAGYGAGVTEKMKAHKTAVIQEAVTNHAPYSDMIDLVSKVGGLDMLGMVGTYLACAQHQLPCVIDGLISLTGLLIASQLKKEVLDYCFPSHCSTEPGYRIVSDYLGLSPMLQMDMRLGEGSGCPLAFFLMESSVYTIEHMPTFEEGKLDRDDYVDIR